MMRDVNIVTLYKNGGPEETVIIIKASHSSASLWSSLLESFWRVSKSLHRDFIRRRSRDFLTNTIRSHSLLGPAINTFSLAEASLQWPQALPLVVKPSFWKPLSSRPSFIFFDPVFFPFSSKAEPFKFTQSYHFNKATRNPLSASSSHPDVLQWGLPSLLWTI